MFSVLLAGALAALSPALAQESDGPDAGAAQAVSTGLSIETLEADRAAAEADTALPDDLKARTLELYSRAIDEAREAARISSASSALATRIEDAPARIEALTKLGEQAAAPSTAADYADITLEQLEALRREKTDELAEAREALTKREKELAALNARGPALSEEIGGLRAQLRTLEREDGAETVEEQQVARTAREAYRSARIAKLRAEIDSLELVRKNFELLVRLATLERDAATLEVPRLDAEREALAQAAETRRADEARAARESAQLQEAVTASLPASVAQLATDNAALRKELEDVTRASRDIATQLRAIERRASELEADLGASRKQVESIGGTDAVGRLLRKRLAELNAVQPSTTLARARADEVVRATDRRIDLGEQRRELADLRSQVEAVLEALTPTERTTFDAAALRPQVATLVEAERSTIDELHEAYGRYVTQLTSMDAVEKTLENTATAMIDFVRRELLWIRSLPPIALSDLAATGVALQELMTAQNWQQALSDLHTSATANPLRTAVIWIALLALIAVRPIARRKLAALGELTSRIRTDAFKHTLVAMGLTAVVAAGWPLAVFYLGWEMGGGTDLAVYSPVVASVFSAKLSVVLKGVAGLAIIYSTVRWVMYRNGLAGRHFRWPEAGRAAVLRELRWLAPVAMVTVGMGIYARALGTLEAHLGLGRLGIIAMAAALAIGFWRMFHWRRPLLKATRESHPERLVVRTYWLWFSLLIAIPVAIILSSATGYHYTATTAMRLVIQTGWLMVGVWVLRGVMLRWFTVAERRMRFERALQQREEARAERARQEAEPGANLQEAVEIEEPEVDFRGIGDQGRAVVQAAVVIGVVLSLVTLWSDLLPALTIFDQLQLPFTRSTLVDGVEQRVAVTLSDALIALVVLATTLYAAKNLSGILGFTVLRRMSDDPGAQYAIVTLCQYALVATGLVYTFSTIGLEWSRLQWLVAALSVGLGFGLQEIVANFVSGIILLLERPVRVGDIVTVGDATGTVSRIRIRATTIVDWDRKELVVPNKEFITGRLLNWTLTNDITRLVIPVGIAYGADPRKARELMLEAAHENEHVLDDPKPLLVFNGFGDNALLLELRVYLRSLDHWLTVQTGLHDAIYDKFEKAGIVISFPQRDVHLDMTGPIDLRMTGEPPQHPPYRGRTKPSR